MGMKRTRALAHKKNRGFTLVETMVFVVLISLIFITLTSLTAVSLKSARVNENKILATHYGEEVREWVRGEKEVNWNNFIAKSGDPAKIYCLNSIIISWPSEGSCQQDDYSLLGKFRRELSLFYLASQNQVQAAITVSWKDGINKYRVLTKTIFARLE